MIFTLRTNFYVPEINYLVGTSWQKHPEKWLRSRKVVSCSDREIVTQPPLQISSGDNILLINQVALNPGSSFQKTFAVAVSRQMAPRARLVLYCKVEGEMLSDSINFFVEDSRLYKVCTCNEVPFVDLFNRAGHNCSSLFPFPIHPYAMLLHKHSFIRQAALSVNLGKDFKRDMIEVIGRGVPGGFIGLNGVDYEFYKRGAATFLDREKVQQPCGIKAERSLVS